MERAACQIPVRGHSGQVGPGRFVWSQETRSGGPSCAPGRKAHKAASQNLKRRSGTTSFGLARGPPLLFEVLVRGETADDRP